MSFMASLRSRLDEMRQIGDAAQGQNSSGMRHALARITDELEVIVNQLTPADTDFLVTWDYSVPARDHRHAAELARAEQLNPQSTATTFAVRRAGENEDDDVYIDL